MKPPYADLHCHSTYSDGSSTPAQLVENALESGLKALAITDHDNIEAYHVALPCAKSAGLHLITGVEFSAQHKNKSVHILGYGFECHHPDLILFCQQHRERRLMRCKKTLALLADRKMPISEEEFLALWGHDVEQVHTLGRPHIAMAMVQKGYVSTVQEAFNKYLGDNRCCHVPVESFSPEQTIALLHKAKGVSVIAHPHLIKESDLLLDLLKMPFDGIECFYGNFPASANARWVKIAQAKKWLMTGGSDFHGDVKPFLKLGSSGIDEENLLKLESRINRL